MPLTPDELNAAVEHLRTLLSDKLSKLDYTVKKNAVLAVKKRYPNISDDQLYDVMRRAAGE